MLRPAAGSPVGDQVCQETSSLGEAEGDESGSVGGAPFCAWVVVTVRKAWAHIARVAVRVPTSSPISPTAERSGPAGLAPDQVAGLAAASCRYPDPRSRRGRWQPLTAILLIAACAVTCDADGFTAIWQWDDDGPAVVLTRLHVRRDPLTGVPRPPSERTIRRTLTRPIRTDSELAEAPGAVRRCGGAGAHWTGWVTLVRTSRCR
jgi:hypothetical protein